MTEAELASGRFRLPVIVVNTRGQAVPGSGRVPALVRIYEPTASHARPGGSPALQAEADLWVRGSSSRSFLKKSYRLEFHDASGADLAVSPLGLPADPDWILLAAYSDRTLIRDVLAYELWRGMGHYAPRWRHVELFMESFDPQIAHGGYAPWDASSPALRANGAYIVPQTFLPKRLRRWG